MTAADPYMDFLVTTAPEVPQATRDQLAALLAPGAGQQRKPKTTEGRRVGSRIPCDYCGLAHRGQVAVWYVATTNPSAGMLTGSRFSCDRHLDRAKEVVDDGEREVTVTPLDGQDGSTRA